MTETNLEDRIPEKLPSDVRVAHKTGSYENSFGDVGIVFYKDSQGVEKRYYLVVLAKDTSEYEVRDAIQEMSLAVYEAVTGNMVDPGWSRGRTGPAQPSRPSPDHPAGGHRAGSRRCAPPRPQAWCR